MHVISILIETDDNTHLDMVEIGNVDPESVNFTYKAGEDSDTVWHGRLMYQGWATIVPGFQVSTKTNFTS